MSGRNTKPIRIFLSYSSRDSRLANRMKTELERFRLSVFLAPEDISPSSDWVHTIRDNLDSCDIFIPLITQRYHGSNWTDQESGYALARGRVILPICFGVMPYGFLASIQAHKKKRGITDPQLVEQALNGLLANKQMRNRFRETFISALRHADSSFQAAAITKLLLRLSPFSRRQMGLIMKNSIAQNQVAGSAEATKSLKALMKRNQAKLDHNLLTRFREKLMM